MSLLTPSTLTFTPYEDNGGTILAIAGDDFAVVAADTRLATRGQIYTRDQKKLFRLSETTILGCSGCWCDVLSLTKLLGARYQMYLDENNKTMTTPACAQMLSTMLYSRRFFPFYISNILVGLDNDGRGCVFSYDPIGHCEKSTYRAGGSAGALMQSLLDNQVGLKNMEVVEEAEDMELTLERAVNLIKDGFIAAAERDIMTGDSVMVNIITKDGIEEDSFDLRKD